MRYRLLAIDLDGTLLNSDGKVSDENRRAIHRAREADVLVALCTGRGLCETRGTAEALDHHGPMILSGGAHVCDPTTGRTLHRATIEPGLAKEIAACLHRREHAVLILLDPDEEELDYLILDEPRLTDNTRWWFSHIHARIRMADQLSNRDLHHVLRMGVVGEAESMPDLEREIQDLFGERVFTQYFHAIQSPGGQDINLLEVFAAGVNKWQGIQWLADTHSIELNEVAALGDHINDVEMIRQAACGVAMGNAVQSVRDVADHVTRKNNEDGVAWAIDKMLNGEW